MLRVLMIVNYLHTQACLFWRRICTSFVRKPSVESDRPGPLWPVLTVLLDEESGSFGAVLVMKSTEDRDGYNIGRWNRLLGWGVAPRSLLAEGLVWPGFVVPAAGFVECPDKVAGVPDQHVIQDLAAKGPDDPLADHRVGEGDHGLFWSCANARTA
jgi:hypothetical protein